GGGHRHSSQQDECERSRCAHDQLSSLSWLSCWWRWLRVSPGRHSLMSPLKLCSSIRAEPVPIVKLKRCLVVPVTLTGKQESKSPLKVDTETVALAFSGTAMLTLPLVVAKLYRPPSLSVP